jgi:hypothetical protein
MAATAAHEKLARGDRRGERLAGRLGEPGIGLDRADTKAFLQVEIGVAYI